MQLDTRRRHETPEGVHLELSVAGPVARGWAWLIDAALRTFVLSVIATGLALFGDGGFGIILIVSFLMEWFYPVAFEVLFDGATPGKRLMHLQVVQADGTPLGWTASVLRNLLRAVDFLPFGFSGALLTMLADPHFRRLGDLVAGTVVIYTHAQRAPAALPEAAAMAPPLALDLAEQRALIDFAERSPGWTQDRVEELAEVLMPALGGPPAETARRLHGMARWLLGARG